ncbi:MAG: alpha/beta hydrolase [Brumimicrobium sp.]|nr:alpha/beta hydrolase [Brumimicrobium sp.]
MEKLVLIHGALGSGKEMEQIAPLLSHKYAVHIYEIPHHGSKSKSEIECVVSTLKDDLLEFLENIGPSYIYGFSLGGYLALSAALKSDKNIKGIITHGTKLLWNDQEAKKETATLNIDFLKNKTGPFFDYLQELHGPYLPELLKKTVALMMDLGESPSVRPDNAGVLKIPVRMVRGGKDKMVTEQETRTICEAIDNCHYFEIPSFIHPVGFLKPKFVARMIDVQIQSMSYEWTKSEQTGIAFKRIGTPEKAETTLIFIHEATGSIAQWQDFPERLCSKLNLPGIVFEFSGYGFSENNAGSRDANYLHELALNEFPAFLESLSLKSRYILVGHSDGGTNALLYSSRFPENIKGIVTMAAHVINKKETKQGIQPAILAYESGKMKGLEIFHGNKTDQLFYKWANTWLAEYFANWNITDDIIHNKVPALIIQGKNDQYGTEKQVELIDKALVNARPLYIENCGHAPHLEHTEEVIEAIWKWSTKLN